MKESSPPPLRRFPIKMLHFLDRCNVRPVRPRVGRQGGEPHGRLRFCMGSTGGPLFGAGEKGNQKDVRCPRSVAQKKLGGIPNLKPHFVMTCLPI